MKQITILLILLNCVYMNAQESPQKVKLEELGVQFELPIGWTGQLESEYILLGHHTISGFMVLVENEAKSVEDLKSKAAIGINEEGISLSLLQDVKIKGKTRVEGFYGGVYQNKKVKAYAIGLLNDFGNGMTILIVTESDKFTNTHISEANKLANTVKFFEPKDSEMLSFWKNRLTGRKFKYLDSSYGEDYIGGTTSTSETVILNFCTNGNFRYYYNQMNTMDTVDASAHQALRNRNTGTYEIYSSNNEIWVDLNFNSGKTSTYKLTTDSAKQKTLFNGTRYYNTGNRAQCD